MTVRRFSKTSVVNDPTNKISPWATPFNLAVGGTTAYKDFYNGTQELWRIHTFEANGIFTVEYNHRPMEWKLLVIGGSGSPGADQGGWGTGGGGAGGCVYEEFFDFSPGEYTVTIGGGAAAVAGIAQGKDGGKSSIVSVSGNYVNVIATGGGGGGSSSQGGRNGGSGGGTGRSGAANSNGKGTAGQGNNGGTNDGGGGGAGGPGGRPGGGAGRVINITGEAVTYCRGGNAGNNTSGTAGGTHIAPGGRSGKSGVVIIAYRAGSSAA